MTRDALLEHVPPTARYRRRPLAGRRNALAYWQEAAQGFVPPEDEDLCEKLASVDPGSGRLVAFPTGAAAAGVERFLEANSKAIERLRAGVACGRVQFPEPDEEGDFADDAESLGPLVQLSNTWFLLARSLLARRDGRAAASELVQLGRMAQMIVCGEGLVVHYLVGCAIMSTVAGGMRLAADAQEISPSTRDELATAVHAWLEDSDDVTQCLRVDLCCHALAEVERLAAHDTLSGVVDDLLDRHYTSEPILSDGASQEPFADDGRLAWRRGQMLDLLDDHPEPFDAIETARLMGRHVADRILDFRPAHRLDPLAAWGRLVRSQRRRRFKVRARLWPSQFRPAFPYELLGPGESARQAFSELRPHFRPGPWARMQPPDEAALETARRRLRAEPNPLGVLAADALLPIDITGQEQNRRRRLREAAAALAPDK